MAWLAANESLIQTALVYLILGYSLQLPLRCGVFSFAGAGFYTVGAYTSGVLAKAGWNPILAVLVAMAASGLIGLGLSMILSRLRSLYLAMATLSFIFIVQLIAESLPITGTTIGLLGVPLSTTTGHLVVIAVLVSAGMWALERSRYLRVAEVLRFDDVLASTVGISVFRQRNLIIALSSVIGALGGSLYALTFTVVIPQILGFELVLTALTIMVIGGARHWAGAAVGAVVVAWLPEWLEVFGYWRPVVHGLVVVAIAVFASGGIAGFFDVSVRRLLKRRSGPDERVAGMEAVR